MSIAHDERRVDPSSTPYGYPPFEPYRISVDQYHRMIDAGIFHPEDRVELLNGLIVVKHAPERDNPDAPHGFDLPIYRLSVDQYHEMGEAGILTPDDRVELLDGFLAAKKVKNTPHVTAYRLTDREVRSVLPLGWFLSTQDPVKTDESEPEPDLAVIRGAIRDYAHRHPGPGDTALVIEVSDSSLRDDRTTKAAIYARAPFPHYWILSVPDRHLEARSEPAGGAYARVDIYAEGDSVPLVLDDVEVARIAVRDLLP